MDDRKKAVNKELKIIKDAIKRGQDGQRMLQKDEWIDRVDKPIQDLLIVLDGCKERNL